MAMAVPAAARSKGAMGTEEKNEDGADKGDTSKFAGGTLLSRSEMGRLREGAANRARAGKTWTATFLVRHQQYSAPLGTRLVFHS